MALLVYFAEREESQQLISVTSKGACAVCSHGGGGVSLMSGNQV